MDDKSCMKRALALAVLGKGNTSPNPMVGAVVALEDGNIVGNGFHSRAGAQHAEAVALQAAGEKARGASLYVTLEPCTHQGRTPPCVDAILHAGVTRVVVATEDPDERARGKGIARLRAAGVTVDVGLCEAQARELNRLYFRHRTTGRPFVTLKMASSLDGAVAVKPKTRTQLTGERAASFVRSLRIEHDAVMVGVGTVLVDDPLLTVRPRHIRSIPYTRIVVDSAGRIPLDSLVVRDQSVARTIVATTEAMPQATRDALVASGAEVIECTATESGRVDLNDLLKQLGERATLGVLCEGGPTLAAALLRAGCVDHAYWIFAPLLLGTSSLAPALIDTAPLNLPIKIVDVRRLGEDLVVSAVRDHMEPREFGPPDERER